MSEMKMSDKFNSIYKLAEIDNKDAIVGEIKALKNFTDEERASIFGSSSILWVLENYTVKELKDMVRKVENNIDIHVGDVIRFKYQGGDESHIKGVILEVTGLSKNRCTALCYYSNNKYYKIMEGISSFDIEVISNSGTNDFVSVLNSLEEYEDSQILKEGDI